MLEPVELETAAPIAELTPISTLAKLATEGKYASSVHNLPEDVTTASFRFSLDGVQEIGGFIQEIYAPGDDTGWAVMYNMNMPYDGSTRLVRGNWKMWRVNEDEEPC